MSEQIKKVDVVESGIFTDLINEIIKGEQELKKFDTQLTSAAEKLKTTIPQGLKLTIDQMERLNKIEVESTKIAKQKESNTKNLSALEQERLKLTKAVEQAEAKKVVAMKGENKELLELREETNRLNKETRDNIKASKDQESAYKTLSRETTKYKNESKELGAQLLKLEANGKKNTKEYKQLASTYANVTANAKRGDAQLKKLDKTVGDNQRSVGNYANATRKLSSALGALGIAFGISTVVRSVTSIIKDYDQAVTDLGAITQKTAEELKPLNDQARALGESTQFSATQVTELQIELAKLGFTVQEITDSTAGIANFAAATGVEIPRAAALAGSALRAFNLEATEIDRVVSTLGVATTKTALDFSQLETGLSTVAPVAASFGFSIEDTTALLGQLSNAGFDASSSATATRNILLNLADANGALAVELGRPIKSADDLSAGLQELQARGIDLASALELTDKRSVAAFSTFISGSGSLVELRDSITDVNGELTKMAEDRLNSVSGAMALLNSAFEGFILELNETIGASEGFKTTIKFLADNLPQIIGFITRLGAYLLIYSQRQRIVNLYQAVFNKQNLAAIKMIPSFIRGLKGMSFSLRGVGTAMKSIPFVTWIALATEAIILLWDWIGATDEATKETNKNTQSLKANNDELERGNEIRKTRRTTLKDINTLSKDLNTLSQSELKTLKEKVEAQKTEAENNILKLKTLKSQYNEEKKVVSQLDLSNGILVTQTKEYKKLQETKNRINELRNTGVYSMINENKIISASEDLLNKINPLLKDNTEVTKNNTKAKKNQIITLKEIDELLGKQKTQEEIDAEAMQRVTDEYQKAFTERLTMISEYQLDAQITEQEAQDQRLIAELDFLQEKRALMKSYGVLTTDIDLEIAEKRLQIQSAFAESIKEKEKDLTEDQKQATKELLSTFNDVQTNITSLLTEQVDKRLSEIDRENQAIQNQYDFQKALAAEGNINSEQSFKQLEQQRIANEKETLELEERKQRLLMISQGLQTFTTLIGNGESPTSALAQTILTSNQLLGFLAGLSGFEKGTDNAPKGWAWTQESGAEIITDKEGNIKSLGSDGGHALTYLERGDKVKTAKESANILKSFAQEQNSNSVKKVDIAGNSYDLLTIKELRNINNTIKSQPSSTTDWQHISSGLGMIVNTTKKNGDKFVSKHIVKA